MADLSLDLTKQSSTQNDLLVIDGDLVLTSDANPLGTNNVLQDILTRLRFMLGEWFMDTSQGLPWFQQILVKNPDLSKIDAIFQNTILGTPGVITLISYDFDPDLSARTLEVEFKAATNGGVVDYTGTISPVTGGF